MTMSLGWTAGSIADHLGGVLVGSRDVVIDTVTTDSRSVPARSLFVALAGEFHDGHAYATDAIAAGALLVIADRGRTNAVPRVEVDDTGDALLRLAARRRDELSMPVVAVTGSTGKTTTKDLIHGGIPGSWASERSFNNEIGVPLTVLSTPTDATVLVLEVGSRGRGHITWLRDAIRPDVAVITNLGVVHLETFGSPEGLADAKHEIIELLGPGGIAVLPDAHPTLLGRRRGPTLTFGTDEASDVVVSEVVLGSDGRPTFELTASDRLFDVSLNVAGVHQALNAAAATAVAVALGVDLDRFVTGMQDATGSDWRMHVTPGPVTVVNDAYNANPQSVAAALETVAGMDGRAIAVLGPMAELGPVCETEHRRMGELAASLGYAEVIVVGVDHGYALGARDLVRVVRNRTEAAQSIREVVRTGDIVLVKASRSAGLEQVAIDLTKEPLL